MKLDLAAIGKLLEQVQSEGQLIANTLREKGSKRFERPIVVCLAVLLGSYYLLYLPPQRKAQGLQRRIDTARQLSQYTGAYKDLHSQLQAIYSQLPKTSDRTSFLTAAAVESLKAEGLTSDSIRPPDETTQSGLVYQRLTITAEVKFTELISWLARLEASKPFIHVNSLELAKSKRLGYCTISVVLSTIVPSGEAGY